MEEPLPGASGFPASRRRQRAGLWGPLRAHAAQPHLRRRQGSGCSAGPPASASGDRPHCAPHGFLEAGGDRCPPHLIRVRRRL